MSDEELMDEVQFYICAFRRDVKRFRRAWLHGVSHALFLGAGFIGLCTLFFGAGQTFATIKQAPAGVVFIGLMLALLAFVQGMFERRQARHWEMVHAHEMTVRSQDHQPSRRLVRHLKSTEPRFSPALERAKAANPEVLAATKPTSSL